MKKIESILDDAILTVRVYPTLRIGQAVWDVAATRLEGIEDLAGGNLDPFHDDLRIGRFLDELQRRERAGRLRWRGAE